ncbi:MAG: nitrate reductase cytochrome c-type subunit [Pseudomonadota bacterium]
MKATIILTAAALVLLGVPAQADETATLRGGPIAETLDTPAMPKVVNKDLRQVRNYPEQPPIIPHKIDGYQVDLNSNRCMACHARTAIEQSQAPMVSITHFMDRDGQPLASISPRRYFCTQCHVVQVDSPPLVENDFVDIDTLLRRDAGAGQQ